MFQRILIIHALCIRSWLQSPNIRWVASIVFQALVIQTKGRPSWSLQSKGAWQTGNTCRNARHLMFSSGKCYGENRARWARMMVMEEWASIHGRPLKSGSELWWPGKDAAGRGKADAEAAWIISSKAAAMLPVGRVVESVVGRQAEARSCRALVECSKVFAFILRRWESIVGLGARERHDLVSRVEDGKLWQSC